MAPRTWSLRRAHQTSAGPPIRSGRIVLFVSQDKVCVQPFKIGEQKCLLLMVCDGHGGPQCAQFFTTQFFKEMEVSTPAAIPSWQSPDGARPRKMPYQRRAPATIPALRVR